jgi:lipopolysaccharide/colanic/teichoic acid biosynthesis glycosyltransferase
MTPPRRTSDGPAEGAAQVAAPTRAGEKHLARLHGATLLELPESLPVPRRAGTVPPLSPARAEELDALVPAGSYARRGKRLLSLLLLAVGCVPALLLALPIALVNACLFRDPRRILYTQPRVGRAGRVFWIYKFRTMREVALGDFDSWRAGDRLRVTRFGRWLRNTHLDELPQLFNVLRGEMDFIGPRPEMIAIDAWACERIPGFRERNALRPGITGLAQVTHGYAGMDVRAYRRKLAADLWYREHLSLSLDLSILARTAVWMLRGRGWRRTAESSLAADPSTLG